MTKRLWKRLGSGAAFVGLFVLAVAGAVIGPSAMPNSPYVITYDTGGALDEYIVKYARIRKSGRPVVLDGPCISACTFVVGLVPTDRVCVTPRAFLAFHSAYSRSMFGPVFSAEGTRLAWHLYPEKLRAMLRDKYGWDGDGATAEHPELIYVEGADLLSIYRLCKTD